MLCVAEDARLVASSWLSAMPLGKTWL